MDIRENLEQLFNTALAAAISDGSLQLDELPAAALERPRDEANGDWASTVALRTAKLAGRGPREIADIIVSHMPENELIETLDIAGPGFINIRLRNTVLQEVVRTIRSKGDSYGKGAPVPDVLINLEYVSANPTGPMHVGHGRWAALGDVLARVLRHAGYEVKEEFYINDHGNQMEVFGQSVDVRYQQLLGRDIKLPDECYRGSYVVDIAQDIIDEDGDTWLNVSEKERIAAFRDKAYKQMLANQKATLLKFGTSFSTWFSESSLYEVGKDGLNAIDRALSAMNDKGYIYKKDGATWFKSTAFGDEKDRVLIKENGDYTYFMSDVAYHYDKLRRGFTHLIDIWGADHHGYVKRCEAMLEAWGYPNTLEVVLGQLVNLFRDGELVRMSKRTGEMITFAELLDEVGVDATRFLMLSRSSDQPIDFDIEVAKKQDASNPVYYVQYAHARICSLLRKAAVEAGRKDLYEAYDLDLMSITMLAARMVPRDGDLTPLSHESELALMRKMADFPEMIAAAARDRAPFRLTHYAQDLASLFHQFYTNCHVIGEDVKLTRARLALADATRFLLQLTLWLLGVSAPEKM